MQDKLSLKLCIDCYSYLFFLVFFVIFFFFFFLAFAKLLLNDVYFHKKKSYSVYVA